MIGQTTLAAAASLFLLSASAHALEGGFYAGLNIGQADHDLNSSFEVSPDAAGGLTYESSIDSKDASFGAFSGYDFGRWFAVEAAFNHLGTSSLEYVWMYEKAGDVLEVSGTADLNASPFSIAALLTIPVGETFAIGLRAGGAYSKLEVDTRADFTFNRVTDPTERSRSSDSEFAPVYGINVDMRSHLAYRFAPSGSDSRRWAKGSNPSTDSTSTW